MRSAHGGRHDRSRSSKPAALCTFAGDEARPAGGAGDSAPLQRAMHAPRLRPASASADRLTAFAIDRRTMADVIIVVGEWSTAAAMADFGAAGIVLVGVVSVHRGRRVGVVFGVRWPCFRGAQERSQCRVVENELCSLHSESCIVVFFVVTDLIPQGRVQSGQCCDALGRDGERLDADTPSGGGANERAKGSHQASLVIGEAKRRIAWIRHSPRSEAVIFVGMRRRQSGVVVQLDCNVVNGDAGVRPDIKCNARTRQSMIGLSRRVESIHRAAIWYLDKFLSLHPRHWALVPGMWLTTQDATAYASAPAWYAAGNGRL